MIFLTREQILLLHKHIIARYGGIHGVQDEGLFPKPHDELHRPLLRENSLDRLKENPNIQTDAPVVDVLCIQLYDFLKVCDFTPTADLPHASQPRLYRQPRAMMILVLFPLIHGRWSCPDQTHVSTQNIEKLRPFIPAP